jgi:hypothetical protein
MSFNVKVMFNVKIEVTANHPLRVRANSFLYSACDRLRNSKILWSIASDIDMVLSCYYKMVVGSNAYIGSILIEKIEFKYLFNSLCNWLNGNASLLVCGILKLINNFREKASP